MVVVLLVEEVFVVAFFAFPAGFSDADVRVERGDNTAP